MDGLRHISTQVLDFDMASFLAAQLLVLLFFFSTDVLNWEFQRFRANSFNHQRYSRSISFFTCIRPGHVIINSRDTILLLKHWFPHFTLYFPKSSNGFLGTLRCSHAKARFFGDHFSTLFLTTEQITINLNCDTYERTWYLVIWDNQVGGLYLL